MILEIRLDLIFSTVVVFNLSTMKDESVHNSNNRNYPASRPCKEVMYVQKLSALIYI